MVRIAKHIIAVVLCLMVIGGAVDVRFYVSECMHSGNVQLAMAKDHRSCCSHDNDYDNDYDNSAPKETHEDGYFASPEDECCKVSSLSVSVSSFEVSQALKLSVDLPFVTIPGLSHFACADGGSLVTAVARAPRIADACPAPIIYLHGQLRL
ncbi:MAG: hypothetical protein LBK18_06725 [Prevotellaceae bacterium]|jgi:hypothetical protein|nr:hypothetical protein [Prevotellaceae bacterium]